LRLPEFEASKVGKLRPVFESVYTQNELTNRVKRNQLSQYNLQLRYGYLSPVVWMWWHRFWDQHIPFMSHRRWASRPVHIRHYNKTQSRPASVMTATPTSRLRHIPKAPEKEIHRPRCKLYRADFSFSL